MKNPFGLFFKYCISTSSLDKVWLVTLHETTTQRKWHIITGSHRFRRNDSSHDLHSQSIKNVLSLRHAVLLLLLSSDVFCHYSVKQSHYHNIIFFYYLKMTKRHFVNIHLADKKVLGPFVGHLVDNILFIIKYAFECLFNMNDSLR